jgi:uncharacterized protein with HEPN domain
MAILKIEDVVKGFKSSDDLLHDYKSWDTVIREFEIIGEATKHLIKFGLLPAEFRVVVDFRNRITHEYFGIDKDEVWDIIHSKLGEFKGIVLSLINSLEREIKLKLIESFIEDNHYLPFIVRYLENLKNGCSQ